LSWYDSLVSGTLEAEGGPLYYEVAGPENAHALLLVHAGVADCRMWDDQMDSFTARYRVIRYDTRGYGRTPAGDRDYSNRQDIFDLLTHLGVSKTYILGVSRGGHIAIDFTLEHPEMVDALIAVNAGIGGYEGSPPDAGLMKTIGRMEELYEKKDFSELAEMETALWAVGPRRTREQVDPGFVARAHALNPNLRADVSEGSGQPVVLDPPAAGRLDQIRVPLLVIVGDEDLPGVIEAMDYLAGHVAGARKVVIHGAAHMANMEKPEEFNREVRGFLDALPSPA
jgi:pimeloyl-ACP methyl ester carboxylesterase